jgi:large subunit ribosomal protein L25
MTMSTLHVERRGEAVKPKHLRKNGRLPMAFVERSNETSLIQATVVELRTAMAGADGLGRLDVHIEGEAKARKAIVKNIDHDAIRKEILHVTLQEVSDDDTIRVDLVVVPTGHSDAADESNEVVLMQPTDHVKVKGKVSGLPERLEVDVSGLGVGEHINAGDVPLPEGVELVSSPDAILFSLSVVKAVSLEVPSEETEAADIPDDEAAEAAAQDAQEASGDAPEPES